MKHRSLNLSCFQGQKILDIGCGRHKLDGAIGLDHMELPGVDVVADLSQRLPFEDDEFDLVYSNQVLEHVPNLLGLIDETYRILKPGGTFIAHVPYFRSSWAAVDPTHVRQFTIGSMDYFVKGTLANQGYAFSDKLFSSLEVLLDENYKGNVFKKFFVRLALRFPNRFENSFLSFLYPFQTLTFVLRK